jgi:hypothetical protein
LATGEYVLRLATMIETGALAELIAAARAVPVTTPVASKVIDLRMPQPRTEIRIPELTVSMVEGYGD